MSRSVLVVDDDAGFRDLATRIPTGWGHAVIGEAGSVAEALAQAARLRPDTVLISSEADRTTVQAAHRAGAAGFLPKDELSGVALRALLEGW